MNRIFRSLKTKNPSRRSFSKIEFEERINNDPNLNNIKNSFQDIKERRMLSLDMQKTVVTWRALAKMLTPSFSKKKSQHLSFYNSIGLFEENIDVWFLKVFAQKIIYPINEFQDLDNGLRVTYLLPLPTENYGHVYKNDHLCWKIVINFIQNPTTDTYSSGELVTAFIVDKPLNFHDKQTIENPGKGLRVFTGNQSTANLYVSRKSNRQFNCPPGSWQNPTLLPYDINQIDLQKIISKNQVLYDSVLPLEEIRRFRTLNKNEEKRMARF